MRGPAICLAQFMRDVAPFNDIRTSAAWAAGLVVSWRVTTLHRPRRRR